MYLINIPRTGTIKQRKTVQSRGIVGKKKRENQNRHHTAGKNMAEQYVNSKKNTNKKQEIRKGGGYQASTWLVSTTWHP